MANVVIEALIAIHVQWTRSEEQWQRTINFLLQQRDHVLLTQNSKMDFLTIPFSDPCPIQFLNPMCHRMFRGGVGRIKLTSKCVKLDGCSKSTQENGRVCVKKGIASTCAAIMPYRNLQLASKNVWKQLLIVGEMFICHHMRIAKTRILKKRGEQAVKMVEKRFFMGAEGGLALLAVPQTQMPSRLNVLIIPPAWTQDCIAVVEIIGQMSGRI